VTSGTLRFRPRRFLFTLYKWAIGACLGKSGLASTYGAAGSQVVIRVFVYYSAQILLFGAELTQVYAKRFGSRVQAPAIKRV
jgi:membrane protein